MSLKKPLVLGAGGIERLQGTDTLDIPSSGAGPILESIITIISDYTITTGKNALSVGPVGIDDGITVKIPDNSKWKII